MSIKQSIAALFVLFSVSFSASAEIIKLDYTGNFSEVAYECTGYVYGDVVDTAHPPVVSGKSINKGDYGYKCKAAYYVSNYLYVDFDKWPGWREYTAVIGGTVIQGCPEGQKVNPDTGKCEEPPVPYCSRPETIQDMKNFQDSCAANGSGFTSEVSCSDANESLSLTCNPPEPTGCEPGSPSWPACLDDDNKCDENSPNWNPKYGMCCTEGNDWCDTPAPEGCTMFSPNWPECSGLDPIEPPSSGDLGSPEKPPSNSNPTPSEPEETPPVEETSDSLAAIKSLNDDLNNQLTGIRNDANNNHNETKGLLEALKKSTDLNTDTVVDAANHVKDAVDSQSQTIANIGNQTNQLLGSANTLLNNGFGDLSGQLSQLKDGNQTGFDSVVGAINELGDIKVVTDSGDGPPLLYPLDELGAMEGQIAKLKTARQQIINDFKAYFNFNSGVNSGDFNSHSLGLNWRGNSINKDNQVFYAMQDNAGIISAVVLFIFGLLGMRSLLGAL